MQISLFPPSVTFSDSEMLRIGRLVTRAFKRDDGPLRKIDQTVAAQALTNAIDYLLRDRIEEGVGKFGWGAALTRRTWSITTAQEPLGVFKRKAS